MIRNILIHTRNLSIPGGKQSYLIALQDHFKNDISYFYYGVQEAVGESKFTFIKRFFNDYIRFYQLLKKGNFDVVHINTSFNPKSYFRDSIFTLISTMLNYKTVVYWHGWRWDFEKKYASKILPYFHFTFGRADAMICLAGEFVNKLREYRYNKPVYLETTVVDDQIINHIPLIESSGSKNGNKVILFLSRVEKEKGIYETIASFRNLQYKFPHLVLNIAGTGSELDRAMAYVTEREINGVHFLGWVDGQEKIKVLSEADIFVLASYSEGMPICVLEAMSMGLPIITTNVGGLKDFFEEGAMGLKVRMKDEVDLAEKLEKIICNPDLIKGICNFNVNYARNNFSSEKVCSRLEFIYESIIDGGNINSDWKHVQD